MQVKQLIWQVSLPLFLVASSMASVRSFTPIVYPSIGPASSSNVLTSIPLTASSSLRVITLPPPRPTSTISRRPIRSSSVIIPIPTTSSSLRVVTLPPPRPTSTISRRPIRSSSSVPIVVTPSSSPVQTPSTVVSIPLTSSSSTSLQLTTSTVFTTRTSTITACPATVTNCPASSTYTTTETVLVSTTVCPVEATSTGPAPGSTITGSPVLPSQATGSSHQYSTETILTTRTVTVTACPETVTDCPARQQTTSVITETLVASTSVYEVSPTPTDTARSTITEVATLSPSMPLPTVHSTRFVTVYACKKEDLALI